MKLPFFAAVLAAGLHSRWLRGSTLSLPGTTTLHLESRRFVKVVSDAANETDSNVTVADASNETDSANVTVADAPNVTEEVPDASNATEEVTEEMPDASNATEEMPDAPNATEEMPDAPNATGDLPGNLSNASNMTDFANVTGGGMENATGGNMTNDTANDTANATEEPVPMDGSAVQKPPPQFVTDFCGEQAEQMTACYTWVTTMHGCYTSCKQTAQINTLEADVGGCLAAMCGYVPPLICGPADQGGICSLDGPENSESSVEQCDRQCESFLGCVTFQTKGQCAMKRTAALFEDCYDGCIAPDLMAFSPRIPPPGDPAR